MSATNARVNIQQEGLILPINGYDADVTPTQNDYTSVIDATAGAVVVNLPPSVANPGRILIIKKGDPSANAVTITPFAADTIDGSGTFALTVENESVSIQSDGNGTWHVLSAGGSSGTAAIPARTLFVSTAWPAGANPLVYFTTISAALTQAAALSPSPTAVVDIIVYPGIYAAPLTLVSNVEISAAAHLGAIITGAITWNVGVGVNAPQTSVQEFIALGGLVIRGGITMDATGKTASFDVLEIDDCQVSILPVSITGRGTALDFIQAVGSTFLGGASITVTNAELRFGPASIGDLTATGASSAVMSSGEVFGTSTFSGGADGFYQSISVIGAVTATGAGSSFSGRGSTFFGGVTATLGATADIRTSEYFSTAALTGGPIDRSLHTFSFGPVVAGANAVGFGVSFLDAVYNAQVILIGGAGAAFGVSAKTASGFTLHSDSNEASVDITINKV